MCKSISVATIALVSAVVVALDQKCVTSDLCFGLGIPDSTIASGSGDIFFSLTAPNAYEWISLGQGSKMDGANMFVIYASADGNNVTISSRLGNGHNSPETSSDTQLTIMDGSGVINGSIVANVRCSNCHSWSGGEMDFSSTSAPWIWGVKSGNVITSDNPDERIAEHDDYGDFSFDFTVADAGQSLNPFTDDEYTLPAPQIIGSGENVSAGLLIAHGVLASLAFIVLFPAGATIIRLLSFPHLIWFHTAIQVFAYLIYAAGAGIGIWLAIETEELSDEHAIIGLVLLGVLFFQPLFGQLHHIKYKEHNRRTKWSHIHIWLGRIAVLLGIVNGGLGLDLSDNTAIGIIAYAVVAAIAGSIYVGAVIYGEWKRSRKIVAKPSMRSQNNSPYSNNAHYEKPS